MPNQTQRVRLEEVDWAAILPWVRLFRSFRQAVHPPKLLLGLLLVFLLYLGGMVMDAMWGVHVYPDELRQFNQLDEVQFAQWQENREERIDATLRRALQWQVDAMGQRVDLTRDKDRFPRIRASINDYYAQRYETLRKGYDARRKESPDRADPDAWQRTIAELQAQRQERLQAIDALHPAGVFETALRWEIDAFERLITGASALRFGVRELLSGDALPSDTVAGAMRDMFVAVPAWLWGVHRGLTIAYVAYALLLWSLLGATIARLCALHACQGKPGPAGEAFLFALRRWIWFLISPLMPLALVSLIGLCVLGVGGLLLLNLPGLDVLGGLLFGLALALGAVIALMLIGLIGGASLMQPAIAIEGTDAFDAVSRVYNYVLFGRPWHWLFYSFLAMIYGAICYLFMGIVIFLTILMTHHFARLGVLEAASTHGVNKLDAMLPPPTFGDLAYWPDFSMLGLSGKVAGVIVWAWVSACVGLLPAFAITFYQAANTWIYLLLRRASDGTEMDEIYLDPRAAEVADETTAHPVPARIEGEPS